MHGLGTNLLSAFFAFLKSNHGQTEGEGQQPSRHVTSPHSLSGCTRGGHKGRGWCSIEGPRTNRSEAIIHTTQVSRHARVFWGATRTHKRGGGTSVVSINFFLLIKSNPPKNARSKREMRSGGSDARAPSPRELNHKPKTKTPIPKP